MATKKATKEKVVSQNDTKEVVQTVSQNDTKEVVQTVPQNDTSYKPIITKTYSGNGLHITIKNVEIEYSNIENPSYSQTYNSYSASVAFRLTPELKQGIFDALASHFKSKPTLEIALANFLSEKVRISKSTNHEILYANIGVEEIENEDGEKSLRFKKGLKISGLEESKKFPFSFKGSIQIGFTFSIQHTFSCYLNAVVIDNVISWDYPQASDLETSSEYNPIIKISPNAQTQGIASSPRVEIEPKKEKSLLKRFF